MFANAESQVSTGVFPVQMRGHRVRETAWIVVTCAVADTQSGTFRDFYATDLAVLTDEPVQALGRRLDAQHFFNKVFNF